MEWMQVMTVSLEVRFECKDGKKREDEARCECASNLHTKLSLRAFNALRLESCLCDIDRTVRMFERSNTAHSCHASVLCTCVCVLKRGARKKVRPIVAAARLLEKESSLLLCARCPFKARPPFMCSCAASCFTSRSPFPSAFFSVCERLVEGNVQKTLELLITTTRWVM